MGRVPRAIGAAILLLLFACTVGAPTNPTTRPQSSQNATPTGRAGLLVALNPADGSVQWRTTLGQVLDPPQLDAGRLIVAAQPGDIVAVDAATGRVDWTTALAATSVHVGAPVIGRGVVVATIAPTTMSSTLVALAETNGQTLWSFPGPGGFLTDPVAADGQVVVAANNAGQVFSMDEVTGQVRWHVRVSNRLSSIAVADGAVCVLGEDGVLRSLDPVDGHTRWTLSVGDPAFASVALVSSVIYLVQTPTIGAGGSLPTTLIAVDGSSGRILWSFAKDGLDAFDLGRSLADGDGAVFVAAQSPSQSGSLYAIDEGSGSQRWSYSLGSANSPPSFVAGTVVLTRSSAGRSELIGLTPTDGRVRWSRPVVGESIVPVRAYDTLGVWGSVQGTVLGFDPETGLQRWRTTIGVAVDVPPVVTGTRVFVIANRG